MPVSRAAETISFAEKYSREETLRKSQSVFSVHCSSASPTVPPINPERRYGERIAANSSSVRVKISRIAGGKVSKESCMLLKENAACIAVCR